MKERSEGSSVEVDDYIAGFPPAVAERLRRLRRAIHEAAPGATERISYRMPAFDLKGILVYFAAYAKHIGFYPTGDGIAAFQAEIAGYASSKGAIQFPHDRELPLDLVARIVRYRVSRNEEKAAAKGPGSPPGGKAARGRKTGG